MPPSIINNEYRYQEANFEGSAYLRPFGATLTGRFVTVLVGVLDCFTAGRLTVLVAVLTAFFETVFGLDAFTCLGFAALEGETVLGVSGCCATGAASSNVCRSITVNSRFFSSPSSCLATFSSDTRSLAICKRSSARGHLRKRKKSYAKTQRADVAVGISPRLLWSYCARGNRRSG